MKKYIGVVFLGAVALSSAGVMASSNNCSGKKIYNCYGQNIHAYIYNGNDGSHGATHSDSNINSGTNYTYSCGHSNCDIKIEPVSGRYWWKNDTCEDIRVRRTSGSNAIPVIEPGSSCP